jgi:hypothetical protein
MSQMSLNLWQDVGEAPVHRLGATGPHARHENGQSVVDYKCVHKVQSGNGYGGWKEIEKTYLDSSEEAIAWFNQMLASLQAEQSGIDAGDVANFFNVDAEQIGEQTVNLEALRRQGVLCNVTVRGTSMLQRRSTRAELGMAADDIRVDHLTAGVSFTIRPDLAKQLRSVESRVRYNLDCRSFDLAGFRPKRYLPFTAWDSWLEAHDELVTEWEGVKLEILRDRAAMVEEMRERYQEIARRAWAALMSQRQEHWTFDEDLAAPVLLPDGANYHNFHDFARDLLNLAATKLPSEQEIRDGLTIEYHFSMITMMSQVQAELAALAEEQARTAEARAEQLAARSRQQQIADEQAAARRAAETWEREQGRIVQAEANAEIARINARTRIIEENIRAQLADMVNPYAEMFEQLRQQIAIDANTILQSLKGGTMRGPTATGARNLIETFRVLNVAGDTELASLIDQLEKRLDLRQPGIPHDVPKLSETLAQIAEICSDEALAIRRKQDAGFRLAEMPEDDRAARTRQPISAAPDLLRDELSPRGPRSNAAPDMTLEIDHE